jgi:ketosteroid isomerase-like protein
VILWHNLNFWTAVGQIAIGVLAGMLLGAFVRRARRLADPPTIPSKERLCPSCGSTTLRRVRGAFPRGLLSNLTGTWRYTCERCEWPARPQAVGRRRPEMKESAAGEAVINAQAVPAGAETMPAAAPLRRTSRDDATQIKDCVFQYLALLNAGDVAARANCYLSEFTSFDADGRPLKSNGLDWRAAVSEPGQTYDLRCRDLRVYIHRDTAIATAYLVGTVTTPHSSSATRVSGRSSWVHLRQNGEWKIAHTHLSPLNPEL